MAFIGGKKVLFSPNVRVNPVGRCTKEGGEIFNNYEENLATNKNAHAEGSKTEATGENSHAQNRKARATGKHSHAQNYDTLALGESSDASGVQTKAYNKACVAEGNMTEAGDENKSADEMIAAHAGGYQTKARGFASNTTGQYTEADGVAASAEGSSTKAKADFCHTEGSGTIAYKPACHSEGGSTISGEIPKEEYVPIAYPENEIDPKTFVPETGGSSSGTEGGTSQEKDWGSHSEGLNTRALAMAAHTEGEMTIAYKYASHAGGIGTIANTIAQYVHGLYNIIDNAQKYLHIVGNGKSDKKRSNAYTLDWDGNAWFAGNIRFGEKRLSVAAQKGSQYKTSIVIGHVQNENEQGVDCDILYNFGEDFVTTFSKALTRAAYLRTITILPGQYVCNRVWNINSAIAIKGVGMPIIEMGEDAVILGNAVDIRSSNVSIEGLEIATNVGAQGAGIEGLRINKCTIGSFEGNVTKSFLTENVFGVLDIISTEGNVIANNIVE